MGEWRTLEVDWGRPAQASPAGCAAGRSSGASGAPRPRASARTSATRTASGSSTSTGCPRYGARPELSVALHAGIDTGGTFTDLVVLDDETGPARRREAPSTPADPADGDLPLARGGRRRRRLARVGDARHDGRHERAARAQGRARPAAHDGGLRGRAGDRADRQGGPLRPAPREAGAVRRAARLPRRPRAARRRRHAS